MWNSLSGCDRNSLWDAKIDSRYRHFHKDESITRGGCFLETPCGDVDARVETQLEKVYQCLEAVFAGKADG